MLRMFTERDCGPCAIAALRACLEDEGLEKKYLVHPVAPTSLFVKSISLVILGYQSRFNPGYALSNNPRRCVATSSFDHSFGSCNLVLACSMIRVPTLSKKTLGDILKLLP